MTCTHLDADLPIDERVEPMRAQMARRSFFWGVSVTDA